MLPEDVQVISVDDHVVEPRNVWQDHLPAKFRTEGPRSLRDDQGRDVWMFEGTPFYTMGLGAVAGKERKDYGTDPVGYDDMLPGCYDVEARLKDMDADGVHAELCFPTFPGFAGNTFYQARDKKLAAACVSAYNDWIIDVWCAGAPGRQIPLALVPFWDVEASAAETRRVAAKGAKAITFPEAPHNIGLPSFHTTHWDPFFAEVQEAELPLCMHFGSGGTPNVAPDGPFTAAIALFGLNSQQCTVELVNSRIFERFPGLRVALSEGGIGWIPYLLERCDSTWERHRWYTGMEDARRPSEIFAEHIYGCFIEDGAGLKNIELIGEDNITFECDYPHSDSNWPNTRKKLEESLRDVPDGIARKIAEDNARRLYRFPRSR
jgi:predicted TIM-barrel fold metal-dependent hydrolase